MPKPTWNPNTQPDDTIVLPVTFVRHVARLRAAQARDPRSRQARELERLVDQDLKVIARVLAEKGAEDFQDKAKITP